MVKIMNKLKELMYKSINKNGINDIETINIFGSTRDM